jgi:hypothetical protein
MFQQMIRGCEERNVFSLWLQKFCLIMKREKCLCVMVAEILRGYEERGLFVGYVCTNFAWL